MELNPMRSIAPVIIGFPHGSAHDLLGTAFFVAPGVLMSAKHVLGVVPPAGCSLSVVRMVDIDGQPDLQTYEVTDIFIDPRADVAVGRVEGWPFDRYFEIAQTPNFSANIDVLSVEFSASQLLALGAGGQREMRLTPTYHKGYIMRDYVAEFGHEYPVQCYDLSYPAFKRASGAPVVSNSTFNVVGMIVANIERQLMPAQLERIERQDGTVEEVRYFLPTAQAIQAPRLRETYAEWVRLNQSQTEGEARA